MEAPATENEVPKALSPAPVVAAVAQPSTEVAPLKTEEEMASAPETAPATELAAVPPAHSIVPAEAAIEKQPTPEGEGTASEPAEPEDENMEDHSDSGSEFEPEPESPKPKSKVARTPKTPKTPKTPATAAAKTPLSRVRSGRVEKTGSVTPTLSPGPQSTLRCPVKGCGQTFTGRNPRQSLWHHLKYYATRGLPDKQEFEKAHGDAHLAMKREAGTCCMFLFFSSRLPLHSSLIMFACRT